MMSLGMNKNLKTMICPPFIQDMVRGEMPRQVRSYLLKHLMMESLVAHGSIESRV